jgi:para-aminobenzoate synthetase component 1
MTRKIRCVRLAAGDPLHATATLRDPLAAVLESHGANGWGPRGEALAVLAARPVAVISSCGDGVRILTAGGTRVRRTNPIDALARFLPDEAPEGDAAPFPVPVAIGWIGYDLAPFIERLPEGPKPDRAYPVMHFAIYDRVLVREGEHTAVVEAVPRRNPIVAGGDLPAGDPTLGEHVDARSNFTRAQYVAAVRRALRHIRDGDIYQVNLSQRFEMRGHFDPAAVLTRARRETPVPFLACIRAGQTALVGASPELFLHVDGRRIETRPIKGTRPRGRTAPEDRLLREELLASPKDDAELAMIVDLERNDLGRICEIGSVRVTAPKQVETYPTVHHLVAVVEGRLCDSAGWPEILRATFPGGSVTGCPKIRAMEIIAELESVRRGIYTGAYGWISARAARLAMAIRVAVLHEGGADVHAGGAIVADSDPQAEYEETLVKASGLLRAFGAAAATEPQAVVR